jgi:hypothetical protein
MSTESRDSDLLRDRQQQDRISMPGKVKNFLFPKSFKPDLERTQHPAGVKRQGREADYSPATSDEAKWKLKLKFKLIYDRRSVGQSILVSGSHLEPMTRFLFSV